MGVTIETQSGPLAKARSVNYTTNGFPSLVPTTTEPVVDAGTATGQAAIALGSQTPALSGLARNSAIVLPYGADAAINNKTGSMRVIGWGSIDSPTSQSGRLWIPVPLVEVQCTFNGTQIGVAGKALIATEGFASTITLTGTTANANVGVEIVSPANSTIGYLIVDLRGFQKIEFIFTTGGSVTSCNALYGLR